MDKNQIYSDVIQQITGVIEGETSAIARYASMACLLHNAFDYYFWTGFYLVNPSKPDELVVGPYQGTLGCLRIQFGRGVCGTCAKTGQTQIVPDVHEFPGHIACDSRSNSEIVVPVFDDNGNLAAVFDVDSTSLDSFDETDQFWLEKICADLLKGANPLDF